MSQIFSWFAGGFILVGCSFLAGCSFQNPEASPPNIVLIYIDDMGWRDLSIMGSAYYETPNIDALAGQGMLMTHAYANAPNCAPSRASLLSGQYGPRHGIYTVGTAERGPVKSRKLVPVENETTLSLDKVTLAEALSEAGYRTGHVGKWHLGDVGNLPSDQGFDWSVAGNQRGSPANYFFPYSNQRWTIPGLTEGPEGEYLADRLTKEAIGFIKKNQDEPFFLYLSHFSVHTPVQGKPDLVDKYRDKTGSDGQNNPTYAAMVQSVDESVGRVLATLDTLGLAETTLVIFYSDNGGFGPVTSMAPLRGSKGMLYEGGIRVPMIVRWPGHVEAGRVSETPVIGTDLYPTLMEIAKGTLPEEVSDGVSLRSLWESTAGLPPRALFWHFPAYLEADQSVEGPWRTTPVSAVRKGRYKLLHFFEDDRIELYDLVNDPSEAMDLSDRMGDEKEELQRLLSEWWQETDAFLPTELNPLFEPDAGPAPESADDLVQERSTSSASNSRAIALSAS